MKGYRTAAVLAGFSLLGAATPRPPDPPPADLVLRGGRILTMDARDTIAQALAVVAGRIVEVGSNDAVERRVGPKTERIDLNGLAVTPGLIDSHCHLSSGGAAARFNLDLRYPAVRSVQDVATKLREAAQDRKDTEWVQGDGWDEGKLAERRVLVASDLDSAVPRHPVWLTHTMGHYGVANGAALRLAGIDAQTPDPPGGTIDRDAQGRPTGLLRESAMGLVTSKIPELEPAQRQEAIARIMAEFSKEGMTAVKDPGISRETWDAYREVLASGRASVRVFALWRAGDSVEDARALIRDVAATTRPYASIPDDRLISGGIKMAIDGSGGARTAWVHDEWNRDFSGVDAGNHGYPVIAPEVFREQFRLFHDAGLHVGVHSIGDRGIDWVVDTLAEALARKPTKGLRHSVIHCNVPTTRALDELARLQRDFDAGYPEASATFMWWIGDTYAGNWGAARSRRLNPFQTFLARGIRWGGGSDYDVTPFPARFGIWASVKREPLLGVYGGDPYGRDEAVDVRTALRSFTIWNARQLFLEDRIGSLEVGKSADLAVWDRDPERVAIDEVKDMKCLLTLLAGRTVYRDPKAPQARRGVADRTARAR